MKMVKEKENMGRSDGFRSEPKAVDPEPDISFVYKPGKEKDFRILPSPTKDTLIDVDSMGGWIAVVIFSWIIILGIVSLVGIEIGTVEISVSLIASLFFAVWVHFLYKKSKLSQRS